VDLFPGFVVFGPGLGVATVAGSIAALGGVAEEHAGVASGTTTAAFQIGGALGGAIATTVVVERGLGAAFATSAVVAGLALAAALVPLRPRALRAPGPQRA
jgi:predicted MFS family arabinose efflux permease